MTHGSVSYGDLSPGTITGMENFKDFECSDPEFEDYLRVSALYDQDAGMGRTYVFRYEGRIVGYIVLAMAHLPGAEQAHLNIDTYGTVPALLISHLATHKRYERRGIGRNMVLWAINYARKAAKNMGCRIVLVGSKPDVLEFYEKLEFVHADTETDIPNTMYFDIQNAAVRGRSEAGS